MTKRCSECSYCINVEFGYSNYTVEGVNVYCSLGLNPETGFDRWYGEDKRDTFASTCPKFDSTHGPVVIDVDREQMSRLPKELGQYWSEWKKGPDKWEHYETPFISRHKIEEIVGS